MPSYDYNKNYAKKYIGKFDELKIRVPKGRKATVEALAAARGESVNGLVNGLLRGAAGVSVEEWKNASSDREV